MTDQATEHRQQSWEAYMRAGKEAFQKQRMPAAARAFNKATQLVPYRVEGWINLGSALLECGEYKTAEAALKKAIAADPRSMFAHMLSGDAQRLQGKKSIALASYKQAVELQRTPLALNKLACAMRGKNGADEAEELYLEAIRLEPRFTLARVNRATLQIERHRYQEADEQLAALAAQQLPALERREVESAQLSLSEFHRLNAVIENMCSQGGLQALRSALQETPQSLMQADHDAMKTVNHYAAAARDISNGSLKPLPELPQDWPRIEGLFMIPLVNSVTEYRKIIPELESTAVPTGDLLESINMAAAIGAAQDCGDDMTDPVSAELHLRHWHHLCSREIPGFQPGHFKYTQNWSAKSPTLPRVDPALSSGTMRHFIESCYRELPPGLARGIVGFLAISDLHPFADGNGRVAMTWLNRELQWAGLMPALFSRELGLRGQLGQAISQVRENYNDLSPMIAAIKRGQEFGLAFCSELESV